MVKMKMVTAKQQEDYTKNKTNLKNDNDYFIRFYL